MYAILLAGMLVCLASTMAVSRSMPMSFNMESESFATIAEAGSMTRAAGRLFMTQSAISMQIKRLEASLGLTVFERSAQGMNTTSAGEQLLGYAQRMLDINDEAIGRLTSPDYEGLLRLGIPGDVIYPHVPDILKQFSRDYPRLQIKLSCAKSKVLREQFKQGLLDVVVTTEKHPSADGQVISSQKLVWTGAEDGNAWRQQPLPLGISKSCAFRPSVIAAIEQAGLGWVDLVASEDVTAAEAMTAADLCVCAELKSTLITGRSAIDHRGLLPDLPDYSIVVYSTNKSAGKGSSDSSKAMVQALVDYLQRGYA